MLTVSSDDGRRPSRVPCAVVRMCTRWLDRRIRARGDDLISRAHEFQHSLHDRILILMVRLILRWNLQHSRNDFVVDVEDVANVGGDLQSHETTATRSESTTHASRIGLASLAVDEPLTVCVMRMTEISSRDVNALNAFTISSCFVSARGECTMDGQMRRGERIGVIGCLLASSLTSRVLCSVLTLRIDHEVIRLIAIIAMADAGQQKSGHSILHPHMTRRRRRAGC
jgi:hypothetical protein